MVIRSLPEQTGTFGAIFLLLAAIGLRKQRRRPTAPSAARRRSPRA